MKTRGRVTIPTNENFVNQTKEIINKWGADAVRDCDGTTMPDSIEGIVDKIYKTYFVNKGDNEWAKANFDESQHVYLHCSKLADNDILKINLLENYYKEQFIIDYTVSPYEYWELIDRTTNEILKKYDWTFNQCNNQIIIKNAKLMHEYTVSFLAICIWDPVHIYNTLTNNWNKEKLLIYNPMCVKTSEFIIESLKKWIIQNKNVNVVRFTTFIYQFPLFYDEKARQKFVDWLGYSISVSPKALKDFEEEYGYKLRPEDFIDEGYYNNPFRIPKKNYLDYMNFIEKFVCITFKKLVDIVHKNGKEAMMFFGDSWIGTEPYGKHFKEIGLDAVVGSVGSGVSTRMITDITDVKYTEGRLLPYFFPDTFYEGNNPTLELINNWINIRRAIMRKPLDRIGFGGYLSLAYKFPDFINKVSDICEEFRLIYDNINKDKPYSKTKIAILNSWGKKRTWMSHMVTHETWYQQTYTYQGVLESLSGLPFEIDFINFDDIKNDVLKSYDVLINMGDANTSFSGGINWIDESVLVNIKKWVNNGGGFIGIGEPTAYLYGGKFFQLSDIMGIDMDIGYSLSEFKYNKNKIINHFILEDVKRKLEYGEDKKNIYAKKNTQILDIKFSYKAKGITNFGEVKMAVNDFGKGRSFYVTGLPYNNDNIRVLYRAILWVANKEENIKKAFSTNIFTECNYYTKKDIYAITNNTNKKQKTKFYDIKGNEKILKLNPYEVLWINK